MSDPLPTDPIHASGPSDEADREARIEELLLSGLDHYFAGQYERAISVWTRVVFLERHHDRAHAYIERARSALAERQRESEELLHQGVAAYNAADISAARDLLTRAVEQGSDTAHVFLDRLNRVAAGVASADTRTARPAARPASVRRRVPLAPRRTGWMVAALVALFVAAGMLLGGLPIGGWLSDFQDATSAPAAQAPVAEPLPVVRASETVLARARTLYAGGHLRDALRSLDRIDIADPFRAEAERLRADIQRDLLAAAGIPTTSPGDPGPRP